jgi:uncharacterized membrane protein
MCGKSRKNQRESSPTANNPVSPVGRPITDLSPGEESRKLLQISRQQEVTQSFSGPLPPPLVLREYNAILPGLAERIVAQAEQQTEHRIRLETRVVNADISKSWAGLICGLVVSLACIGSGVTCVLYGHDWAGTTIATGAVVGLVSTFIYGTAVRKAERTEKTKILAGQK